MYGLLLLLAATATLADVQWKLYADEEGRMGFHQVPVDTVWITWKVDSLNVGFEDDPGHPKMLHNQEIVCYGPDCHEWVFSGTHFRSQAQLPSRLLSSGEEWAEEEREVICPVCLRHEWQVLKYIPVGHKQKSDFEYLKDKLQVPKPDYVVSIDPDSLRFYPSRVDTLHPKLTNGLCPFCIVLGLSSSVVVEIPMPEGTCVDHFNNVGQWVTTKCLQYTCSQGHKWIESTSTEENLWKY